MEEALNSLLHRSKNELNKAARKQAKLENAKLPKKPRIEKRSDPSFGTFYSDFSDLLRAESSFICSRAATSWCAATQNNPPR